MQLSGSCLSVHTRRRKTGTWHLSALPHRTPHSLAAIAWYEGDLMKDEKLLGELHVEASAHLLHESSA